MAFSINALNSTKQAIWGDLKIQPRVDAPTAAQKPAATPAVTVEISRAASMKASRVANHSKGDHNEKSTTAR